MSAPGFSTFTFTSNMDAIDDLSHYPSYCRKGGKDPKSNPVRRSREIFDLGKKCPPGQACTRCLERHQDCVRYAKFTKCCFCTVEDLHPRGMCHLPGEPEPSDLSETAKAKKRKLDSQVDTESIKSASLNGRTQFQIAAPHHHVRGPLGNSVSLPGSPFISQSGNQNSSPIPRSAPLSISQQTPNPSVQAAATLADMRLGNGNPPMLEAALERIAALESQVANLQGKFIELQVKLNELEDERAPQTPRASANFPKADSGMNSRASASAFAAMSSTMDVDEAVAGDERGPELTAGVPDWASKEGTPEHTVSHAVGFAPQNCICSRPNRLSSHPSTTG